MLVPMKWRTLACVMALAACSPHARSSRRTAGEPAPLPAGLYYQPFEYSTCAGCPVPRAVVLLGLHASAADATRALRATPDDWLQPGYPMAAHSDELGLVEDTPGIALIAGQFPTEADASVFLAAHSELRGARVVGVLPADAIQARRAARYPRGRPDAPYVVRLSAPDVPAFARAEIDAALGDAARGDAPQPRLPPTARELCRLGMDTIFVSSPAETEHYREWAPVRCGEQAAYVRWLDTLIGSTIIARDDGSSELIQITDVSCDVPDLGRWRYDVATGRGKPLPVVGSQESCAARR